MLFSVQPTNGFNPGSRTVTVFDFLFSCAANDFLLEGLASGVVGMAGLGRTRTALPLQFPLLLALSPNSKGVIFFSDGPYVFPPNIDASDSLAFMPLFINPANTASARARGEPSAEYFIGVKSIKVDDRVVPLNSALLSIDSQGLGGTKISTEHTWHAFGGIRADHPTCFAENENLIWRIFGANLMVHVHEDMYCPGFVNGGSKPTISIVIGGHQLEDMLLQFDSATSRLGFSSALLRRQTTCADFNFTSTA
ncbi:hypothetical protein WN944_016894 [Citrus x changshan-huyou]|uniref:Xylanase inhibitor C-terminal domain-containing protein n=1 Tax=Citrus x changshan-huyou TaxID=2935761 RepID=A0AAP0MCV9_9ROSI